MGWFSLVRRNPAHANGTGVLETVIGHSTTLSGTIRCDGGVRIEGRFEGIVEVGGNVVVGRDAIVAADIAGKDVVVGGVVKGNIESAGRIEILSTGQVFGDLTASAVMIDEGGFFQGISRMRGAVSPSRALAAPRDVASATGDSVVIDLTGGRSNGVAHAAAAEARDGSIGALDFDVEPVIPDAARATKSATARRAKTPAEGPSARRRR